MLKFATAAAFALTCGAAHAADPAAGAAVFKSQCGICHTAEAGKNRVGPSLFGIVGQHAGAVEGFRYSPANKAADIIWDTASLGPYLANPKAVIPGTTMLFIGIRNETQRDDVIAYLATLK